jgi:hypothetical protein
MRDEIDHGCNLRAALQFARSRGCTVRPVRRTGELLISHPAEPSRRIRVSGHRKDTPRSLTSFLLKLPVDTAA